jgi:hypothetical protein
MRGYMYITIRKGIESLHLKKKKKNEEKRKGKL